MNPSGPTCLAFLKAPVPGTVKTRLAAGIGEKAAVAVYCRLAEQSLRAIPRDWQIRILYSPPGSAEAMQAWLREFTGATFHPQTSGDLGARLEAAFADALRESTAVFAIGGDCPGLDTRLLEEARAALSDVDCVLGPATDGGYYLIGLRRPAPQLFQQVHWSTATVLAETLERARDSGMSVHLLPERSDIDTAEDLERSGGGISPWQDPRNESRR